MKGKVFVVALTAFLLTFSISCGSTTSTSSDNARSNNANSVSTAAKPAAATTTSAPPAQKPELSVTAEALYQESKTNKNVMDKYQGKVVEISGKFAASSGSENSLSVRFETSGSAIQLLCKLADGTAGVVSKYEKGQDIKMIGVGDRFASIDGLGFKDCRPAP